MGDAELQSVSLVFLPSQRLLAALSPSPTHALSLTGNLEMEALCQVGNESPPKPPNPLYLFHGLRGWMDLHFINHSLWDSMHFTQPDDSQNYSGAWAQGFLWTRGPSPPLQMFQQSLQSCSRARSLDIDIMSSAYWAHFTDVGKENKDPSPATIH